MMIGFVAQTCITALRPYLTDDRRRVGTHVESGHLAATPKGMTVTAKAPTPGRRACGYVDSAACLDG
ncbi:hypothetical protein GCM10023094_00540 [Rhodococcus olei]|uniref:Fluoroacetyl-CoA-specific thioesterase-like domain-containing protein n=2 Tax=Rhodococcus olei TaxID=2161675 RepID=A0ABP8NSX9_9NOCA